MIREGGRTSYLGDVLAVVVADNRQTARRAAAMIEIDYDVLQPMVDPVRVVDSPDPAVWELEGNTLSTSTYSRGDAEAALANAAYTVDEVFQTQRIEHAFLEPEATLAVPTVSDGADEPDSLYVYTGGQGIPDTILRAPHWGIPLLIIMLQFPEHWRLTNIWSKVITFWRRKNRSLPSAQ